jgi:hypothetical protein
MALATTHFLQGVVPLPSIYALPAAAASFPEAGSLVQEEPAPKLSTTLRPIDTCNTATGCVHSGACAPDGGGGMDGGSGVDGGTGTGGGTEADGGGGGGNGGSGCAAPGGGVELVRSR